MVHGLKLHLLLVYLLCYFINFGKIKRGILYKNFIKIILHILPALTFSSRRRN